MRFAATDSSGRREPAPGATEHFHFLDALRGLAALWVVLFHLSVAQVLPSVEEGGAGGFMWLTVFRRGGLGVAVFFVLSGFVIAHSLRHGLGSRRALRSFATGRLLRLTPPYWAAIVVAIVIHGLASIVNREPFAPGGGPLSVSRVFSHLVYLQGVVEDPAISEVFWTLAIEMQFYLAFAVFLIAVHLLARRWPAAFRPMVWALGALSVVGARSGVDPQLTLAPLFYSFALGAIIYWVHIARLPPLDLGIFALGLLVLAIESPSSFLNASLVTGGLLVVASVGSGLSHWLASAPLRFLGRISYSLYLVHVPVQGAIVLAVVKALGSSGLSLIVASVASTIACLGAATVFWWAVERPSMALASRLRHRTAPSGRSNAFEPVSTGSILAGSSLTERA